MIASITAHTERALASVLQQAMHESRPSIRSMSTSGMVSFMVCVHQTTAAHAQDPARRIHQATKEVIAIQTMAKMAAGMYPRHIQSIQMNMG